MDRLKTRLIALADQYHDQNDEAVLLLREAAAALADTGTLTDAKLFRIYDDTIMRLHPSNAEEGEVAHIIALRAMLDYRTPSVPTRELE